MPSYQAQGAELRTIETEGSIGFTGTYVSENLPNPKPPTGPISLPPSSKPAEKPSGKLPQTSFGAHQYWIWLGWILVILSIRILFKRFKEEIISKKIIKNRKGWNNNNELY
ncbi:LPXTG cell wall anchor domain-containing protein [Marinilactibacillus kalidii]|uniref:LPXTG cell wall anchor domain-containing protein n=1 Tax=Marinilactibacillus kalidii TaxID=2820274 RepID=UPI001ABE02AF|nr:LPXTG cell wall anchor domain-containing protein [Marinilactibacillus kalidii]